MQLPSVVIRQAPRLPETEEFQRALAYHIASGHFRLYEVGLEFYLPAEPTVDPAAFAELFFRAPTAEGTFRTRDPRLLRFLLEYPRFGASPALEKHLSIAKQLLDRRIKLSLNSLVSVHARDDLQEYPA